MPTCPACRRPVERKHDRGPVPSYCGAACRARAYRRREADRVTTEASRATELIQRLVGV